MELQYSLGLFSAVVNLSQNAGVDSHGGEPLAPFNAGQVGVVAIGGTEYLYWYRDHLGVASHDPIFVRRP
jgi:hypothetical protein